jgi:hypothetical protein
LDDGIDDTFVSSVREEVSFTLIDFQDWLNVGWGNRESRGKRF